MKNLKIVLTIIAAILSYFFHSGILMATPDRNGEYVQLLDRAENLVEDHPEEAAALIRDALGQINENKDPLAAARAHFLLGEAAYFSDDNDKAIGHYQKAAEINVKYGHELTTTHITTLGNLGFSYDAKDQKTIALDYYEQALAIARQIGDTAEIAANLANIGQLKTIMGHYAEALEYMEEALAIDRAAGDESIIATDLNTIGRIYDSWGLRDKAVQYLEEAMEIDTRLGNEEKIAIRLNSLGLVYKNWQKYDRALESFQKALEIDARMDNPAKVALRRANIGSTFLAMARPDQAIPFLEQAISFYRENNMPSYLASSLNDLGRALLFQKRYAGAKSALEECLAISRSENLNTWEMSSLSGLSDLYQAIGQYQKSLEVYKNFVAIKDSLFSEESQRVIAEFQVKYDLFKEQQKNEILRRDQELSQRRQEIFLLIFGLSALFLLSFLLALLVRLKNQQNRRLVAEQENQLLKIDLDQRNKELTYNAMCIIKNNETVAKMAEALEQAIGKGDNHVQLRNVISNLQHMENDKSWKEFEIHFVQTHRDFYNNLHEKFPDLTPNEKKLCAFLRLNLSTKDIASITHQSVHSINVARTRLRKKLGIDGTDENLGNFLSSL